MGIRGEEDGDEAHPRARGCPWKELGELADLGEARVGANRQARRRVEDHLLLDQEPAPVTSCRQARQRTSDRSAPTTPASLPTRRRSDKRINFAESVLRTARTRTQRIVIQGLMKAGFVFVLSAWCRNIVFSERLNERT